MSVALPPGRFSRLVLKVNVFLLIALVLAAAFMAMVAYKQGWFVHQSPVHFVTVNALGINKGMPVKLHGFTVGSVSDMQLAPGGVDVRLLIGSEYLVRIPQDSHAKHAREAGFIGAPEYYQHAGGTSVAWVQAMYHDLLGRTADLPGQNYWVQQLPNDASRNPVAYGFAASAEHEGLQVQADYRKYLSRSAGPDEVAYWVDQFAHHRKTNEDVVTGFVSSDEYFRAHSGG